jgi:drug/metabolite transporter (DMT)-like permease
LLSWPILGERVGLRDIVAVVGCFLGIAWFFIDQLSSAGLHGNLLALSSGAGLGLLPLLLRRSEAPSPHCDARTRSLLPQVPTVVLLLGNALVVVAGFPQLVRTPSLSWTVWLWLILLGVVQIARAYLLYAAAVRRLRAVECLMLASLEPILNPLWVALGTGELPSRAAVYGGLLIVSSVISHGIYGALRKPG